MIAFVVHLIRRSPHDYWDVISMTPATSHVVYNSIDLDHMTMRCKYLQCTPINTFLYYLVPFLVKKMIINWKISTYLVRVSFFSVQTLREALFKKKLVIFNNMNLPYLFHFHSRPNEILCDLIFPEIDVKKVETVWQKLRHFDINWVKPVNF